MTILDFAFEAIEVIYGPSHHYVMTLWAFALGLEALEVISGPRHYYVMTLWALSKQGSIFQILTCLI